MIEKPIHPESLRLDEEPCSPRAGGTATQPESPPVRIDRWRLARHVEQLQAEGKPVGNATIDHLTGGRLVDAIGAALDLVEKVRTAVAAAAKLAELSEVTQTPEPRGAADPVATERAVTALERATRELLVAMEPQNGAPWAFLSAADAVRTRGRLTEAERQWIRRRH